MCRSGCAHPRAGDNKKTAGPGPSAGPPAVSEAGSLSYLMALTKLPEPAGRQTSAQDAHDGRPERGCARHTRAGAIDDSHRALLHVHALVCHRRFRFLKVILVAPVTGTQAIVRLWGVFVNRWRIAQNEAQAARSGLRLLGSFAIYGVGSKSKTEVAPATVISRSSTLPMKLSQAPAPKPATTRSPPDGVSWMTAFGKAVM
jgi:hypothetical protein